MSLPTNILFQVISALIAILIIAVWVKPAMFKFLLDKDSLYPSLGRQGQYTALIISTWVLVAITLNGEVHEWMFASYMVAWAGAQFGSIWLKLNDKSPKDGTVTSTETNKHEVSTETKGGHDDDKS